MSIDKSQSGGGSVTHGHGHAPDGTDPEIYTPRIPPTEGGHDSNNPYGGSGVLIMNAKNEDRTASFFAQPGILAGKLILVTTYYYLPNKFEGPQSKW